ncbi:MAG: tetratricopeptide repeat protein [Planctomycetes bacterium]|nr:tetratricopeptide repeat protein [Planctomycetota bacterium]
MGSSNIFVGRHEELDQFKQVLERPDGEAVVVVGPAGMGKTWLINKMGAIAEKHPDLKCGWVRYEVTPTDGVDSTMSLMMDNAFEAAQVTEGAFSGTERGREQWRSLLNIIKIGDLMKSLRRDPQRNTREQFLEKLNFISEKMPENGRAVFIVDPEKYMLKDSDQAWAIVVKGLPEKIKFVFAQRPEDVLVDSEVFDELGNVVCIPENGKRLGVLDTEAVDELIGLSSSIIGQSAGKLEPVLRRYEGYPYALGGALKLLEVGVKLEELPERPEPVMFAEKLWDKVCDNGDGAVELMQAYAVLEVGVPDDVVEKCSGLNSTTRKRLQNNKYLRGLLREDGEGWRIYHAIFADHILGQMGEEEKKKYHERAVAFYRGKLKKAEEEQVRPDELAAMRLPEHVLAAEGQEAFVYAFINECTKHLLNLGLFDTIIGLSERGLEMIESGSSREAMLYGNLGIVYQMRGDLGKAEEMHKKSLEINENRGRLEGMANDYGNLGIVYQTRSDLDKAEEMYEKSLEINEKLGRLEGMASQYSNLGVVYQTRGELDKAEEMHKKSLEIDEKLGQLEGMAIQYGNLGVIYKTRGELDKAEEMHKKSLEIEEKLGRLEGMANQYGNLGNVYKARGDLDKAEEMYGKSLEINEKRGRLEGMANDYGNLGIVYKTRGELDKAEEMYKKSLAINKKLGRLEGMANQYANLGNVYLRRGELDKAEEMIKRSLEINEKLGRLEGMANGCANLGVVYERRGEVDKARQYWEKSRDIFVKMGAEHMAAKVQGWIDEL